MAAKKNVEVNTNTVIHTNALIDQLYQAYELDPQKDNLLVLGDAYEDNSWDKEAEVVRWLANEGKMPFKYEAGSKALKFHHETWHTGWYWWCTSRQKASWGYPTSCVIPHRIWQKMNMEEELTYEPMVFKEFTTMRAAIEYFILAWYKPDPKKDKAKKEEKEEG